MDIKNWTNYLSNSRSLSANTVKSYTSDIKLLIQFLEKYKECNISIEHIKNLKKYEVRSWILYRREKGETSRTVSRGLSALKNLMKYLIKRKVIDNSDLLYIKPPKIEKSLPRPLSVYKINEIITSVSDIKQTDWIIKRDRTLLVLIYSVGLRIIEALNLNKSDIINSSDFINIIGKGGKERRVPIIDSVKDLIIDYIKSCKFRDSKALFVNRYGGRLSSSAVQKLIKNSRKLLGLSNEVTPHALRHSCATHLMENNGDLRSIQELLGHSSITSTQIYADVAQRYISDVYDRCHPLSKKQES